MTQRLERTALPNPPTLGAVSAEGVRDELQRILKSALFLNSQRPGQFLRFVVESTLAGRQEQIKEYLIGVEVFGRPEDYDPKQDPIVRIEAGRLRKRLGEYYSGLGVNDPLIIDLPKGGYVPAFRTPFIPQEPNPARPQSAELAPVIPIRKESGWSFRAGAIMVVMAAVALASVGYVL